MTAEVQRRDRLASPAVMFYWLLLLGGLGLLTAIRRHDLGEIAPLWAGGVTGSALGIVLALRDLRAWIAALVVVSVPVLVAPFVPYALENHLWLAFLPGAVCGYLVLSDRLGLVAFWFPAVIWMLSILEHVDARAATVSQGFDSDSGTLLAGLALLFLGFLRAREHRRIGLWRAVSATPLATSSGRAVLREAPGHAAARAVWTASVAALTFGLTAWVAPHLWKQEALRSPEVVAASDGIATAGDALPCCPGDEENAGSSRIREYFELGHGRADEVPVPGVDCVRCGARVGSSMSIALVGATASSAQPVAPLPRAPERLVPPAPGRPAPGGPPGVAACPLSPTEPGHLAPPSLAPNLPDAPVPPDGAAVAVPPSPTRVPAVTPPAPSQAVAVAHPRRVARHREPTPDHSDLLRWILTLLGAGMLFQGLQTGLRPLRRLLTLRHLRRPYWSETVDQRVSNSWQLALIGLRDAGFRPVDGESPGQFAKRVGSASLAACAIILERARHGLGLDAGDQATMAASADATYREGRQRASAWARFTAWLRWPLA